MRDFSTGTPKEGKNGFLVDFAIKQRSPASECQNTRRYSIRYPRRKVSGMKI